MNHLPDTELALHAGNDLPLDAHLPECAECRGKVEEFRKAMAWLDSVAPEPREVQVQTLCGSVLDRVSRRRPFVWWGAAAAAAIVALVVFTLVNPAHPPKPLEQPRPVVIAQIPVTGSTPVAIGPLPKRTEPRLKRQTAPMALIARGGPDPIVKLKTSDPNIVVLWVANTNPKDGNTSE